jgi:tRNA nucleotidyltransferase (CCA-adding enzyme)
MTIHTSEHLKQLAAVFQKAGFTLYITGGCVRDCLLYGAPRGADIDICAAAPVGKVKEILAGGAYRLKERNSALGTVAVVAESGEVYEYTAFRRDSYRGGTHVPAAVGFVGTAAEDALRRDFTVNSIYYDIAGDTLLDPVGGAEDIKKKILRTADKPEITFGSDGLRLMRLARFACLHGFSIDTDTLSAAKKMAGLLQDISRPRLSEEFFKILEAPDGKAAYEGLRLLQEIGLLFVIIPELAPSENFAQNDRYHAYDVLEHTFQTVRHCKPPVRMAALLHDIGKPYSETKYGNSYHHTDEALRLCPRILKMFGYSEKRAERVLRLIEAHMYDLDAKAGKNKIKGFILKNQDILDDLLDLKQADYLASGRHTGICPTVTKWQEIYDEMKAGPLHIKQLAVTAEQLIEELKGIMPQTDTAKVLGKLLAAVVLEGVKNERGTLLARARSYY